MEAVAARAIRRNGRAVLRRQTMIALKKCLHTVGGQIVFCVQPFRRVTAAAHLFGNFQAALDRFDFVFGMAAGAGWRIAIAGGNGFAVDALRPISGFLFVTLAAGCRLARKINRRGW